MNHCYIPKMPVQYESISHKNECEKRSNQFWMYQNINTNENVNKRLREFFFNHWQGLEKQTHWERLFRVCSVALIALSLLLLWASNSIHSNIYKMPYKDALQPPCFLKTKMWNLTWSFEISFYWAISSLLPYYVLFQTAF